MPRLTVKAISSTIKTLTEDVKLKFHLHHEQIMALRHDRDYMREELSNVSSCLAQQLTINDLHSERIDKLTQLAKEQVETIRLLSDKVNELTARYETERGWNIEATKRILALEKTTKQLAETVTDLDDDEMLLHQWVDRQQARIVALERKVKGE